MPGKVVGHYQLERRLGAGSFASVFLARKVALELRKAQLRSDGAGLDLETDSHRPEEVAIKAISRSKLNKKLESNLQKEVSILQGLAPHENIVRLFDTVESRRHIYLVMEFCAGGDLHALLKMEGVLKESVAQHFMRDLVEGMRFLLAQDLIHRDLKPQNLLLSKRAPDAVLKIADFGFATQLQAAAMADTMCGSPLYMAPEILDGRKYDFRADVWSAGTILYEMLVGKPPFYGGSPRELLRNIKSKPLVPPNEGSSKSCRDLLSRLLQVDPKDRADFQTFYEHEFIRGERGFEGQDIDMSISQLFERLNKAGDKGSDSDSSHLPDSANEDSDNEKEPQMAENDDKSSSTDGAWEIIPDQNVRNAASKISFHTATTSSSRKRDAASSASSSKRSSASFQTSKAVQALRFSGELCKQAKLLSQVAEAVVVETATNNRLASAINLSHYHDPYVIALLLTMKCLKILELALRAADRAGSLPDKALLDAGNLTRKDAMTLYETYSDQAALYRSHVNGNHSNESMPSPEKVMLEIILQLGRATAKRISGEAEDKSIAKELLDSGIKMLEVLCAESSLAQQEREFVVGLTSLFMQKRRIVNEV